MNKVWLLYILVALVTAQDYARNILDDNVASNHANQQSNHHPSMQITDEDIRKFSDIYMVAIFVILVGLFAPGLFFIYRCFQKRKMSRAIKEQMKLKQYEFSRMAHLPLSQLNPLVLHL